MLEVCAGSSGIAPGIVFRVRCNTSVRIHVSPSGKTRLWHSELVRLTERSSASSEQPFSTVKMRNGTDFVSFT